MDKETLQRNNESKFQKNKRKDEVLRALDNKLATMLKKIEKLMQKKFIIQREIKDIIEFS